MQITKIMQKQLTINKKKIEKKFGQIIIMVVIC